MNPTSLCFTSFKIWQVVVPVRSDVLGGKAQWPALPIHLVEGTTSDGFTAVGECARGTPSSVVQDTLRALLNVNLLEWSPPTIWMQAFDPSGLPAGYPVWTKGGDAGVVADAVGVSQLYPVWSWQAVQRGSYLLIETLWLDAVGKRAGLAAHQLLGGAVRRQVAVDFWANRPDAPTLLRLVEEASEKGLRGMKIKSSADGDTVQTLHQLRDRLPADFRFTIDPMCGWRTWRESQPSWNRLAELPMPVQVEDPFPYANVDDWRKVRDTGELTLICHARDETTLRASLREGLADAFNLGGGSAYEFGKLAAVAEFHGKDVWHGSGLELGVAQQLHLHAAACARNCTLASDLQSEWIREHTLIQPRMEYRGHCAVVPDRPGLGVALNLQAVEKYAQAEFAVS